MQQQRKLIDPYHQTDMSYAVRGDDGSKLGEVFVIRSSMMPPKQRRKQRAKGRRKA
ncbi:hypothetical protein [Paenibacillus massiliensis]|uniref:hypothetical protein n=1 Tax=Paenibacillus massiliensis TaxID=225917 RepID=UPI0003FB238A|nr:hypothetical protein [Paenibacillus massiliensis]